MNRHLGMSDASCAVALPDGRFLAADDERNVLAVYDGAAGGPAIQSIDLGSLLGSGEDEVDLEGAAVLGDRVWWIASHGRKASGKKAASRRVLFATRLVVSHTRVSLTVIGRPYTRLVEDLLDSPRYKDLGLRRAERRAPKEEEGLNIEGLAAGVEGGLDIGFRSPLVHGRALIARLENPAAVTRGQEARLGPPCLVDLGGEGVRALEWWAPRGLRLIVGGPVDSKGAHHLHVMRGDGGTRIALPIPEGFNAEAVVSFPGVMDRVLLLSDDGSVRRSGAKAKELPPEHPDRYFRSLWMDIP